MTLDQLETFVAVARAHSFSRAAVLLDLAQPTLSGRIAALEREFGVSLFHRRGHVLALTDAGRSLLPYAERILALRVEGRGAVERIALGGLGRLALGANPSCSQYLVPRLVEEFARAHPDVPINVRTALSPLLMESLLDGVIELAICSRAQLHVSAQVLWSYSDPLALVAAPRHALARKSAHGDLVRADLAGHTVLSTQAGPTRLGLRHILPPGTPIAIEATAGEVMKQLLLRGVGVSVLPTLAIAHELERGELVRIGVRDAELPDYEVALVAWAGRTLSPAANAFVQQVREARIPDMLAG